MILSMVWVFLSIFAVYFVLVLFRAFIANPVEATLMGDRLIVRDALRVRVLDSLIYGTILLLILIGSARLLAMSVNLLTLVMTIPASGAAMIGLAMSLRPRTLTFDRLRDLVRSGATSIGTMSALREVQPEPPEDGPGLRLVFEESNGSQHVHTIECSDERNLAMTRSAITVFLHRNA